MSGKYADRTVWENIAHENKQLRKALEEFKNFNCKDCSWNDGGFCEYCCKGEINQKAKQALQEGQDGR